MKVELTDRERFTITIAVIAAGVLFLVWYYELGWSRGRAAEQRRAVIEGAARWVPSTQNGLARIPSKGGAMIQYIRCPGND